MPKKKPQPLPPSLQLPSAGSTSLPKASNPQTIPESANVINRTRGISHTLGRRFPKWENLAIISIFALVLVVAVFYIMNGQPLINIETQPPFISSTAITIQPESQKIVETAFTFLGEYNDEVFTYNKGVKKIYAFDSKSQSERTVGDLDEFDSFWWHEGTLITVSHVRNVLGNIYTLALTQTTPAATLVTDRDSGKFPRSQAVAPSMTLAWANSGDAIAFVSRDTQNNTESLFIYDLVQKQLIYTPARNMQRISSILWVSKDSRLSLVAISDNQEARYFVDRQGGGFTVWNIK